MGTSITSGGLASYGDKTDKSKWRRNILSRNCTFQSRESGRCGQGDTSSETSYCDSGTMQGSYQFTTTRRKNYSGGSQEHQFCKDTSHSSTEWIIQRSDVHLTSYNERSLDQGTRHGSRRRVSSCISRSTQDTQLQCSSRGSSYQHHTTESPGIPYVVADHQTYLAHPYFKGSYQQRGGGKVQTEGLAGRDVSRDDRRIPSPKPCVCSRERSVPCSLSSSCCSSSTYSIWSGTSQGCRCCGHRSCTRHCGSLGKSRRRRHHTYPKCTSTIKDEQSDKVHSESICCGSNTVGSLQNLTCTTTSTNLSYLQVTEPEDPYNHEDIWLVYTTSNLPGPGIDISIFNQSINTACQCDPICNLNCPCICKYGPNYKNGCLVNFKSPIFECNVNCKCKLSCINRIVQNGPIFGLEIFNTNTVKGLGLKINNNLSKNMFICEYAGEVIDKNEALKRIKIQNNESNYKNYIITINEHCTEGIITTIVDPTYIGNIGRYANHSCFPTAKIYPVRSNSLIPHLALFSTQDLLSGMEITFDYSDGDLNCGNSKTLCVCGAKNCRGFLPQDLSLF